MKSRHYLLISVFLLVAQYAVAGVAAAQQLAPTCGAGCTFNDLVAMVKNGIDFIIKLSPLVAAIGFGIAGFYYMTDQGSGKGKSKAHEIFYWTLIGFVVILAAWLIIRTMLVGLGVGVDFIRVE